jgi:LysR family glycine cleavage system transcriptional activator
VPLKETNILRSLQHFEAVYRRRSVKMAAQDLGVTQSAVSHQLRCFSEAVGQQLLFKSGRGIGLTPAGEALGARLLEAFAGLKGLVSDIAGGGKQTLQLAVCSSFGPGWLIDRLDRFYQACLDVELELHLYGRSPFLTNEVADVYIVAEEIKPGFAAVSLVDEVLIAVEAPPGRDEPHDRRRRLITTDVEKGHIGEDWIEYCKSSGIRLENLKQGPFRLCSHHFLAIELAKRGFGAALVPDFLAARDISSKALVSLSDRLFPTGRTYRACFRSSRASERAINQLAGWLVSTAGTSDMQPSAATAMPHVSAPGKRRLSTPHGTEKTS